MFRKISDFIKEWEYESQSTIKVFSKIEDNHLNDKINENIRSIAVLAWHITITLSEMMNKTGLAVVGPEEDAKPPATMKEILSTFATSSKSILDQISMAWKDEDLENEVNMYGDNWTKGTVLTVLIRHQAHHRGQLTILMRQAGYKVPGIYGPSKEEWAEFNMPAMD